MNSNLDLMAYLSGYADGEGCFCVTFNKSKRHRFGWDIRPSFSVSQNGDRAQVLELFQHVLGCGSLRPDRSDHTIKYEVRSVADLSSKVIPHFEQHPLLSSKQKDFERFAQIVRLMHEGEHLRTEGITRIFKLASGLNATGKKKYQRDEKVISQMNV